MSTNSRNGGHATISLQIAVAPVALQMDDGEDSVLLEYSLVISLSTDAIKQCYCLNWFRFDVYHLR